MAEEFVVYGDFDGYFYTEQEKPVDKLFETKHVSNPEKFDVNVYTGDITNIELKDHYLPHEYENYDSLVLAGVKGLTLKDFPKTNQDESVVFSSLILINPEYVRHWFTDRDQIKNGSKGHETSSNTYVHVRSKIIGKTVNPLAVKKVDPPNKDELKKDILNRAKGCGSSAAGCLSSIFPWLKYLLLLLLLFWLMNKCNDEKARQRTCNQAAEMKMKEGQRKRELDSLNKVYDTNMENELGDISKVYFYENSAEISAASMGTFNSLLTFMKKYPEVSIIICGYENPLPKEKPGTDRDRVESLSNFLREKGVDESRLQFKFKGSENPVVGDLRKKDGSGRYFNRNMRVEILLIKNGK